MPTATDQRTHPWGPVVLLACCVSMPGPLSAQDAEENGDGDVLSADDISMDDLLEDAEEDLEVPVVVTGSRVEQPEDLAPVRVEVIRREEIEESGARDLGELLEERGDLQVVRSFRGMELWLRGLAPEYTLVLLDGDRIPGRIGGAIDLSRFGVENIERVEVVRGPSSALYGSDAIGGVVNIITRDSGRDLEADALLSYGLNNTIDGTGRVAVRPVPEIRLRVDGGYHGSDAFGVDPDNGATTGSQRRQWSLGTRLDWAPSDKQTLRVNADYVRLRLQGVDAGAGAAMFDRTQVQEQFRGSVSNTLTGPQRLRMITRLTYQQFREQYLLDQRGSDQLDNYEDNREHLVQLTNLFHIGFDGFGQHGVTFGFEQIYQALDSDRLSRTGSRTRFAVFAQDEWVAWEEGESSLTLVPGIRYDLDSQFGDQLAPKLALRYDPLPQLVLRASYGRGFRAPSFQDLLLRFENPTVGYIVEGNPNLGAETSHGVDVSAVWSPTEAVELSVAGFRNDINDLIAIVTVDNPGSTTTLFSYENIARAWTMGLETSASIRLDDILGVRIGYTLTETRDEENDRQLEGRARHRLTTSVRLAYEPFDISFVVRGALMLDRTFFLDPDGDGIDEAVVPDPLGQIDMRLAKRFTRHLELFVGIDNLLDAGDAFTVLRPFTVYGGARGRY